MTEMKPGIERVISVNMNLLRDCYYIVDQTRPGDAMALYATLRDDVEKRGHIMFVFNGAAFPLGFIKGQILRRPDFKNDAQSLIQAKADMLYVDKKYQNNGIGQSLLRAYEDYCAQNGVGQIVLYSAPTQQALRFYAKNGYECVNNNYLMRQNLNLHGR